MNAYGIELRGIQHNERMSEETNCYSAKVFVDGKHVFDVSNHGHGGCDDFHPIKGGWTVQQIWDFDAKIKAESPDRPTDLPPIDGKPFTMKDDLESIFGDIVTKFLIMKDFKRHMRSKVLFVLPGENPTKGARQMSYKGVRSLSADQVAKASAAIAVKYPNATIMNNLTDAELSALIETKEAA